MRLCRHADGSIGNSVRNLRECISGAGADDQCIQAKRGSQRFGFNDAVQNAVPGQSLHTGNEIGGTPEAGIGGINGFTHNRQDIITCRKQILKSPQRLGMGAEGTAECIS